MKAKEKELKRNGEEIKRLRQSRDDYKEEIQKQKTERERVRVQKYIVHSKTYTRHGTKGGQNSLFFGWGGGGLKSPEPEIL